MVTFVKKMAQKCNFFIFLFALLKTNNYFCALKITKMKQKEANN